MKKLLLSMIVGLFCLVAVAQHMQVIPLSAKENKLEIRDVNPESFSAKLSYMELGFDSKIIPEGNFSSMFIEDGIRPSNIGQANLPVISKMIEVPYGAEIMVVIESYDEEVINLSDYGVDYIIPTQPSYTKNITEDEISFVIDEEYYTTDEYETTPLVQAEISGIMRGMRVGRIEIRPYHYNPVENTLIVYNNLEFSIDFVGSDLGLTEEMKNKYYTNEFDGVYSSTINYIAPAIKDAFYDTSNPVKYVIVANTAFETTLAPFVQWKTRQGYNVIEYYVATGTANTSIQTYLQGLYDAATASDPAPLYVLIVGDHSGAYSIPAFDGETGSHVTDLYFATYDGASDNIPDLYMGRLSANTTTELQNALDKILPYEQYTMPSTSHLNNAVLIAGVDPTWGPTTGDASIYYWAEYFVNTAHGFSNIYAYYQNEPSGPFFAGDSDDANADDNIIANISAGIGFANYTAHCMDYGWADPSVTNADIVNFNNLDEYPFMIGNCCLSFQFNASDAFGENLLQTANEGAVGYIGTSNNSMWHEDFYWGVGTTALDYTVESNVGDFSPTNTDDAVYDALFHEGGQSYSEWYYTASQIVYSGNAAVQSSTSGSKQYYWEIYHCSGDPSLMPYMSEPDALTLSFANPMVGSTSLTVTTEPYTYVALSKNNVLIDAKWSGAGTSVTLVNPAFTGETYCVVGTKQDRSPYINESVVPIAADPPVADFVGVPTTILEGQFVTFTDLSDYAAEWSWDFGDGTPLSTEQHPVHVYSNQGTYTVELTVTNALDSDFMQKIDYITVNINTNEPTADFIADVTTIPVGGTVNFTDLSIDNPSAWDWTFEGGTPGTSGAQHPSVVYDSPGVYQVSLVASNVHGDSPIETKLAYITVELIEACAAGSAGSYEYIDEFILNTIDNTAVGTGLGGGGYQDWTAISTDLDIGSSYPFTINLGSGYASDKSRIWIDFNHDGDFEDAGEQLYEEATANNGPHSGTIDIPMTATAGPAILRIRLWDSADEAAGVNGGPCGEEDWGEVEDYTVNLISPMAMPVAYFSADETFACGSLTVQFTDESTGTPDTWAWDFGDGSPISNAQNPSHTFTVAGTYTVELIASNGMGADDELKIDYITVGVVPTAVSVTGGGTQCEGTMTLTATGGTNGTIYWQNTTSGGTSTATASSSEVVSATGTYYFRAQSADACWSVEGSDLVTIDAMPTVDAPADVTACVSYTLPALTNGDYYENTGGVDPLAVGTVITVGQTVYVYASNGTCEAENSFSITLDGMPLADAPADVVECESYTLPALTNGDYYETTGGVNPLAVGTSITIGQTIYVYAINGTCEAENSFQVTIDAMPTVDAPADVTACVLYTLPALTNGDYYEISGGLDPLAVGTVITVGQTVYVYASNGTCEAENSFSITLDGMPLADAPADVVECESYTLPALTNGDYYENTGGVNPLAVGTVITTDQTVYVYATNGTCEAENSFQVTIDVIPLVDAPADVAICEAYALPALTNGDYYENTGGVNPLAVGTVITLDQTIYVYAASGTCEAENSFQVTIHPGFTLSASTNDETGVGNNDGNMTVEMTGGTPDFDGVWSSGAPTNTSGITMTQSGLTGGTYTVTVTDANGCTAEAEAIVNTDGAAPVANFEADVLIGCETLTVQFTDLSANNPTSWAWTFGDGEVSDQQSPEHTYTGVGTYSVTLIASNAVGDSEMFTITDYIIVGSNPVISLDITPATGEFIADGVASVTITEGTAPYNTTWSDSGDGTGLVPGSYSVMVVDALGCFATEPFVISWFNAITGNEITYSIFPNPTHTNFTVQFDNQISELIEVYDVLGKVVISVTPNTDVMNIDVSNLKEGMYFVKVRFGDKEFVNKLIVN